MLQTTDIRIKTSCEELTKHAQELAQKFGLPLYEDANAKTHTSPEVVLELSESGLALVSGDMRVRGDFSKMLPRIAPAKLQGELLVKAAKLKDCPSPTVIDATAGLGEDSFLLAAAGFAVVLYELNPIIAALLEDALSRALTDPQLLPIVQRMTLVPGDSISEMQRRKTPPDVVFLDPMFPQKRKSALAKKKLQLIQQLEHPCEDESALLQAAFASNPRKIVIKRPLKGPHLAGVKPSYSLQGKTIRYDCIALRST